MISLAQKDWVTRACCLPLRGTVFVNWFQVLGQGRQDKSTPQLGLGPGGRSFSS